MRISTNAYRHPMFLGIDPGLRGAIALYDPAANKIVSALTIPTYAQVRNGKKKLTLDIPTLVRALGAYANSGALGVLERVAAYRIGGRRQGGTSMFSFGKTVGAIEAALVAAGITYRQVMPGVWKKALQCPLETDAILALATQLMPESVEYWTPRRKVRTKAECEGIGEAALIAYYGAHALCA